jgi:hypothetical protein
MIACVLIEDFEKAFPTTLEVLTAFTSKLEVNPEQSIYISLEDGSTPEKTHQLTDEIIETLAFKKKIDARMGGAEVRFVSFVAAHQADVGKCLRIPQDQAPFFLADQSASWLPIRKENQRRLQLLGLRTLGKVAGIPIGYLIYQFGKEGRLMAELARGIDPTPLSFCPQPIPAVQVYRQMNFWPDTSQEQISYQSTPVKAKLNAIGYPQAVWINAEWLPVNAVLDVWRVEDRWWTQRPIDRHYFRVWLEHGETLTLFQDLRAGKWYQLSIAD